MENKAVADLFWKPAVPGLSLSRIFRPFRLTKMRSLPCRSLSTRRYGKLGSSPVGLCWVLLLLRRCNGIIFISLYHHLAVNRVNGDRFDVKSRLAHGTN